MRHANRPQAGCYKAAKLSERNASEVDRPLPWHAEASAKEARTMIKNGGTAALFLATRSEIAFHLGRRR
jgi:hypothetical protein